MATPTRSLIGSRIREERRAAGFTQQELAEQIGLDAPRLSRIENGERGIDSLVLRRIATAIEVPMDVFFEDRVVVHGRGDGDDPDLSAMIDWARELRHDIQAVTAYSAGD
jgi:transcriptional regulator with XRE-family HTH domain